MLRVKYLGRASYSSVLQLQYKIFEQRKRDEVPDHLLLVEHYPPVFTIGRRDTSKDILVDKETLKREYKAEIHKINRGGAVTYHGPGQLVGYPIFKLGVNGTRKNVPWFIQKIGEVLTKTLHEEYNLKCEIGEGKEAGVWMDYKNVEKRKKLGFMGFHFSQWVTMHGFSLNVESELELFEKIIPCGMKEARISSVSDEVHQKVTVDQILPAIIKNFGIVMQKDLEIVNTNQDHIIQNIAIKN